jgi:quercetin dioxygenase-like cupin family protein
MGKVHEELLGNAVNLEELVGYSDGSVISRTVIDKKVGTITLFSFDAGQGLSEHTAPFDAFVQILDGAAEITVGGEAHVVSKGEMIILPAGISHSLKAKERFKLL